MLIINADDYGCDLTTTNSIVDVFKKKRITSATAMVFMDDSQRAAEVAISSGWDIGLHLNFTSQYTDKKVRNNLFKHHNILVEYFNKSKYHRMFYAPELNKSIEYCFNAQYEEYQRLYRSEPSHIDGHHHIHMSSNVIFSSVIPRGAKVRKNFSYRRGEVSLAAAFIRKLMDIYILRKYKCTDYFYSLVVRGCILEKRLKDIVKNASRFNIEIMVHPAIQKQYKYLMNQKYYQVINNIPMGSYRDL